MSGKSKPNHDGGRGGGGAPQDDCSTLSFETTLYSPSPSVIAKLKVGEFLRIELDESEKTVLALTDKGEIAGTIVRKNMIQIIDCLRKKFKYKGEVLKISGGNCLLDITSR